MPLCDDAVTGFVIINASHRFQAMKFDGLFQRKFLKRKWKYFSHFYFLMGDNYLSFSQAVLAPNSLPLYVDSGLCSVYTARFSPIKINYDCIRNSYIARFNDDELYHKIAKHVTRTSIYIVRNLSAKIIQKIYNCSIFPKNE